MNESSDVLSKKKSGIHFHIWGLHLNTKLGEFAAAGFPSLASHSKAAAGGRVSELGVNININIKRLPT